MALIGSESVFRRTREYIQKGLGVTRERAARAEQYIDAELAAVSERLLQQQRGGDAGACGLHGGSERPTLSDLSFASLVSPALGVSASGRFPPPEMLGGEYAEKAARWRATPAGRFVVELLARRDEVAAVPEAPHPLGAATCLGGR